MEKDGVRAEFTCLYGSGDSVRQAVAMAAAEQLREVGIQMHVEGTSWDDISKRMFSNAVLMGWGAANPYESYCLFHSSYALRDDYYNPEGYVSAVTDGYLEAAMEARTTEEAYENWKLAQWDGSTGTAMEGPVPLGLDCERGACLLRPGRPGHRPAAAPSPRRLHAPAEKSQRLVLECLRMRNQRKRRAVAPAGKGRML